MRRRRSARSASGTTTSKERIAVASITSVSVVISASLQSVSDCFCVFQTPAVSAATSLPRDPFADEGRTVSEFDPARFVLREKHHCITVDQFDLRKVDGDHKAVLERGAKDFQAV